MKNMMIKTLTAAAAIALGAGAFAQDVAYSVPYKSVSIYGGALKPNEITATETPDGFKFVFGGEPVENPCDKAIQMYCEVFKLTPGKYHLNFQIKGTAPATSVVAQLAGKPKSDEKAPNVKIGEFKTFNLTGDWQEADLPLKIEEPMLHGFFILRVGSVPKGGQIEIKPDVTITPAD